ncbi:MAG: hypothetical protein K2O34_02355 [Acetatifactor sp.]|nr:hypothetical protein [Acetatifactor sp.]
MTKDTEHIRVCFTEGFSTGPIFAILRKIWNKAAFAQNRAMYGCMGITGCNIVENTCVVWGEDAEFKTGGLQYGYYG